jgi:hypothetical protein
MNAYELADIVDKWAYKESAEYLTDAATLIRQQADRIRNLEKTLGFKNSGYETINLTPQLDLTDEEIIAEAEKQDWLGLKSDFEWQPEIDFARAILRKAQEK